MIGIVAPLLQEASVFKKSIKELGNPFPLTANINLIVSGIGTHNALKAVNMLLDSASHIISWGTAAGLVHDIKPGTLLLPESVTDENGNSINTNVEFKERLARQIPANIPISRALLGEASKILRDSNDKKEFQQLTGAVARDMESATIASISREKNISFNAVRVVTDDLNTAIPPSIFKYTHENGTFNTAGFITYLALNPGEWNAVYHLTKNFNKAKGTMKTVAKILLEI